MNDEDYRREMDELNARDNAAAAEIMQVLREIRDAVLASSRVNASVGASDVGPELHEADADAGRLRSLLADANEDRERLRAEKAKLLDEAKSLGITNGELTSRLAQIVAPNKWETLDVLNRFREREALVYSLVGWAQAVFDGHRKCNDEDFGRVIRSVRAFQVLP